MEEEERRGLIVIGLILLLTPIAIFEISQLEIQKSPQKNPISQTIPSEDSEQFILTMENEGTEILFVINESEFLIHNQTTLKYRGRVENFSEPQYVIIINKSMVDTIKVVQP